MTAPARFPSAVAVDAVSQGNNSTEGIGMSPGKFSKRRAMSYRQHFVESWKQFLHAGFEGPEHVAHVFGVEGSTARKWWDGQHAPSGFAVGYAYELAPDAAQRFLNGVT